MEEDINPWHRRDIDTLKDEIVELRAVPDPKVEELYSYWCERTYAAGWMGASFDNVHEFAWFLREEMD